MLKLLKYEMIQSYRQYFLTLGIFLILCVLAPLLPDFISQVLSSLMIFAMLGISIAVLVNVITNFNRSMFWSMLLQILIVQCISDLVI